MGCGSWMSPMRLLAKTVLPTPIQVIFGILRLAMRITTLSPGAFCQMHNMSYPLCSLLQHLSILFGIVHPVAPST